ncbi:hypothetical protein [Nocardia brasiliensis]|uniref:hypothetical protein n=1 Tax=Nocardia brasiliensis TaxID=37326 RepID=UPI002453D3AC|nr:hypothetical protein [Nocardia brasiliensis]
MRRRCAACKASLPAGANPRRIYCGNACAAKAYRARKRRARAEVITGNITWAYALFARHDLTEAEAASIFLVLDEVRCPMCGTVTWPGVRHRKDIRYCSQKCRRRAYRWRRGEWPPARDRTPPLVDHDAEP